MGSRQVRFSTLSNCLLPTAYCLLPTTAETAAARCSSASGPCSASRNSAADWYRSSAPLAIRREVIASSTAGRSGTSVRSGTGSCRGRWSPCRTGRRRQTAAFPSPSRRSPRRAKTDRFAGRAASAGCARAPCSWRCRAAGRGSSSPPVPSSPVSVSTRKRRARPKSSTFTCPASLTMMLPGLMSRWTTPLACAASSAVGDLQRDVDDLGVGQRLPRHVGLQVDARRIAPSRCSGVPPSSPMS